MTEAEGLQLGADVLRVDDPEQCYAAVRLLSDLPPRRREFRRENGGWVLPLPRIRLARLEYQLELSGHDGTTEFECDPANRDVRPARSARSRCWWRRDTGRPTGSRWLGSRREAADALGPPKGGVRRQLELRLGCVFRSERSGIHSGRGAWFV